MNDPVAFTSRTARFGLPYLFSGQAQKEFYINEAYALLDSLIHPLIDGTANFAPQEPAEGTCWLIGPEPEGEWIGRSGQIACFQSGSWLYAEPRDGLRVYDRAAGKDMRYQDGWQSAAEVAPPKGGKTVDAEARAAIAGLIKALVAGGILTGN